VTAELHESETSRTFGANEGQLARSKRIIGRHARAERLAPNLMARRAYGSGRLFVQKDARGQESWYGMWWAGGRRVKRKLGPKRQPGSRDGLTRSEAERELRRRMDSDAVAIPKGTRRTVAEAGSEYVDHLEHVMERKRSTIQDYRGYLRRHLGPFFAARTVEKVEPAHIAAYLKVKREDGLSSKSVQNQLNFLHGLFAFAIRRGWAQTNPVALVDRPKKGRPTHRRLRYLQPDEVYAVIWAVPDDELGEVERVLYLTAVMTGARQGELLGLRWIDIDWIARRVRIADNYTRGSFDSPKSHEGRSVPLADTLAAELERHFQRSAFKADEDLVFCHPETGHVLDPSKLRKRFREALDRAGVPPITFHELRHTFGTQMAAYGAPLRAIQEWMGHADAKTTEVYRHYAPDPTHGHVFAERAFGRQGASPPTPLGADHPSRAPSRTG
jgi:integrase